MDLDGSGTGSTGGSTTTRQSSRRTRTRTTTLDEGMAHLSKVKRLTFDAGWMRWGWPERVGGLGGSTLLRGYLGEALTARGLVEPGIYSMTEVLAPTMIDYAAPSWRRRWCRGCSAATRRGARASPSPAPAATWPRSPARPPGPTTAGASTARRCGRAWPSTPSGACCSPAPGPGLRPPRHHRPVRRHGTPAPAITVRPIETIHGREEFCEVFFDDVVVPVDRMLGDEGQGWAVAMDLLPFERSTALWHRGAYLHRSSSSCWPRPRPKR